MTEQTNQIIIECENQEKGYDIFEEVQNQYSLYDNCVIDWNEGLEECEVVIEGKDLGQVMSLAEKLLTRYPLLITQLKVSVVPLSQTIIDKGRKMETGGLKV